MRLQPRPWLCVLSIGLSWPVPGSCPLLIGLRSAECRHAFFHTVSRSDAGRLAPLTAVARFTPKKKRPYWVSRGGITAISEKILMVRRTAGPPPHRPRGSRSADVDRWRSPSYRHLRGGDQT